MLTCKEAAILLSQDVDRELSTLNRLTLQAHLAICSTCRQIRRQFRLLRQAIDKRDEFNAPSTSPGLSEDSKAQLKQTLRIAIEHPEANQ